MCSSGGIIYTSRYFCTGGNEMKRTRLTCQFPTGQLWRGVDTRCVNTSHKHGRIRFSSNVFTVLSWVALVLGMTWLHQIVLSKQTRQLGYGQRNGWVRLKSVNVYNTHTQSASLGYLHFLVRASRQPRMCPIIRICQGSPRNMRVILSIQVGWKEFGTINFNNITVLWLTLIPISGCDDGYCNHNSNDHCQLYTHYI